GHLGWCMRAYKAGQTNLKFVHPVIDDERVGTAAFGYLTIVKSSDLSTWSPSWTICGVGAWYGR
ncbi:MAG: hypothetical protein OXC38_01035, partial [Gammaproteobacteria bacterium]|nr:hypothetical protein [Gammaproteobacteria bacterium]